MEVMVLLVEAPCSCVLLVRCNHCTTSFPAAPVSHAAHTVICLCSSTPPGGDLLHHSKFNIENLLEEKESLVDSGMTDLIKMTCLRYISDASII